VGEAEDEEEDEAEAEAEAEKKLPGEGTRDGEKLREAETAFERGDYVRVREIATPLVESAKDDEVARHARDLRRRTLVDPVQIGVIVACLALFAYIVYTYVL